MKQSLVTLITPVYNAMPYLADFLDSLIRQTYRPLQVILADDGSDDDSLSLIRSRLHDFKEADISVRVISSPHAGQAHAVNEMLPFVEGEYLTWCDADDLLSDDSIEKKTVFLKEHQDLAMVRNNGLIFDEDRQTAIGEYAKETDKEIKDIFEELLCDQTYCFAGAYMVRSDLLFDCYPLKKIPESLEGQNLQLLLPVSSRSLCGYLDEKLHTYRRHTGSHSLKGRSYQEALTRIKNFTALKKEILNYCDCDRAEYEKVIMRNEEGSIRELMKETLKKARNKT